MDVRQLTWPHVFERVGDREVLTLEELRSRFFGELPKELVLECLTFLESESLPVGLMRPDDDLIALTTPPSTWNPIRFLVRRATFEDRIGEMNSQLYDHWRTRPNVGPGPPKVRTFGDYVTTWCGAKSSI
jgi:hypothetical protein